MSLAEVRLTEREKEDIREALESASAKTGVPWLRISFFGSRVDDRPSHFLVVGGDAIQPLNPTPSILLGACRLKRLSSGFLRRPATTDRTLSADSAR